MKAKTKNDVIFCDTIRKNITQSEIGSNMRRMRKDRHISADALADALADVGVDVSASAIGAWERGERCMSAVQLYAVAHVLRVPVARMYGESADVSDGKEAALIKRLSYWDGNKVALFDLMRMYMALNQHDRSDIAFAGLCTYEQARDAGRLIDDTQIDTDFIEREWRRLLR